MTTEPAVVTARSKRGRAQKARPQLANSAYQTEAKYTRQLIEAYPLRPVIWEPTCCSGMMARVLAEAFGEHRVIPTDLHDYGYGTGGVDFLVEPLVSPDVRSIVFNPPNQSRISTAFAEHACELMRPVGGVVALFQPHEWDCAKTRWHLLRMGAGYVLKVVCHGRPRWIHDQPLKATPQVPYAWYVWDFSPAGLGRSMTTVYVTD